MNNWVRDLLEGLIVVGLGGMTYSAINKLRHRQIAVVRCGSCGQPTSRVYARCPRCGA